MAIGSRTSFAVVAAAHEDIPTTSIDTSQATITYDDIQKESLLGMGGSAQVYRGTLGPPDHRTIAVKEPRFDIPSDQLADLFAQEASLWTQLEHDHILDVIEWGTEPSPWIALAYAEGGTLADRLPLSNVEQSLWVSICLARGVKYAHKHGVVHLDLKPENVLFRSTSADTWDVPQITDWGLARLLLEYTGEIEGLSYQYAAPEQCDPDTYNGADEKTDIYQLGAVIYALLTGQPPVSGSRHEMVEQTLAGAIDPPSRVNPSLPDVLDIPIMRALATDPEERYEDVLLIRQALERAFLDIHAIRDSPQPRVDDRRTGLVGAPGPTTAVGVEWSVDEDFTPAGSPAVVDDRVYLTTREGTAHAFSVHAGTVEWNAKLSTDQLSAPVVAGNRLFATARGGTLHARLPGGDRHSWELTDARSVLAPPTLDDGAVLLATKEGRVTALEFPDTVVWTKQTPGRIHAPPAIRGTRVFVPTFDGLACLDRETGAIDWEYTDVGSCQSSPAVVGDTTVVGGADGVVALDITTGKERWAHTLEQRPTGVAATPSHWYVSTAGGTLVSIDAHTGEEAWRYTQHRIAFTPPVVGEETVFVCCSAPGTQTLPSRMDDVYAVARETGRKRWAFATETEVDRQPTIAGDGLVVADSGGRVYMLR